MILFLRTPRTPLHQPAPELAVPGSRLGLFVRLGFDLGNVRNEVHFSGSNESRLLDEFEAEVHDGEHCKGQVRGDEVGGKVLFRVEEDVPGEEDQDDGDHDDGVPGSGGFAVETRPIRQISAVHALESHPLVETDV